MNKVLLLGRFTREPEISYTPSGTAKLVGSVVTTERYTDREGAKKEKAEYHRVVAWGKLAEIIHQYFNKGDGIFIEGKNQTRSWEQDGQTKYMTEVVINNFEFPPGKSARNVGTQRHDAVPDIDLPDPDDDIPF